MLLHPAGTQAPRKPRADCQERTQASFLIWAPHPGMSVESLSTCPNAWKAQIHRFGEGLYRRLPHGAQTSGIPRGLTWCPGLSTGHSCGCVPGHWAHSSVHLPGETPVPALLSSLTLSERSSQWAPWCLKEHKGPPDFPQLRPPGLAAQPLVTVCLPAA